MTVDLEIRKLRKEVAQLRQQVRSLKGAAAPSRGASFVYAVASEADDRMITLGHDDIASPYNEAAGYLNMNKNDPLSNATGAADVGYWGKSDVFSFWAFWRAGAYLYLKDGSDDALVINCDTDKATFGVPIAAPNMTTTERNALSPGGGWIIYNTTDSKLQTYNGSSWVNLH